MRTLLALAAAATMTSACVIVVDGDDDDWDDRDSFRMSFAADMAGPKGGPITVAETRALDSFDSISASAGTDVTVVPGDTYEIRLDERALRRTSYEVKGDTLRISCDRPCGNGSRGRVEVVTPSLEAISVSSGAHLEINEGFASVDRLNLSASSGGHVNAKMLEANAASASASSGGSIHLSASQALTASASSGGSVKYNGNPDALSVSESSGGSVKKR
ncbi:MAG: DUF2807 domain-containing protein [Pseudomonadota bacterium]